MNLPAYSAALLCLTAVACARPESGPAQRPQITLLGGQAYSPVGPEAVAYVSLQNIGQGADTLLEVTSSFADTVTLHDSRQEGGMIRMSQVGRLEIPAGVVVEMAPGGLHLMLQGLRVTMQAGHSLPLRLQFARAGALEIEVPILRYGATH